LGGASSQGDRNHDEKCQQVRCSEVHEALP
jgi:hypothetical protein